MAKKLQFSVGADNSPALAAISELTAAVDKLNFAFKTINQAQKAAAKDKTRGSHTMMDPDELNAVGGHLKNANDLIKSMGVSQEQWQKNAGFKGLKEGFDGVSSSVKGLFGDVTALLTPIEALTGAGVIAGLAKVANSFNSTAVKNKTVTYETGMSVGDTQRFVNKASEFGINSDDARSGLTDFSQFMRHTVIHGGSMLATLTKQLGIKNVGAERVNTPGQLKGLLDETMAAVNKYGSEHPAMRKDMIDKMHLSAYEPMMIAPPDMYKQQIDRADKLDVPSEKDTDKGYKNQLNVNHFFASSESFWRKVGSHGSDTVGNIAEHMADYFNADLGWGKNDKDENKLLQDPSFKNSEIYRHMFTSPKDLMGKDEDGRQLNENEPSGIGIDAPAPPQQFDLNIKFDNAPAGMKVTTKPDSNVRVRPTINYSSVGQ